MRVCLQRLSCRRKRAGHLNNFAMGRRCPETWFWHQSCEALQLSPKAFFAVLSLVSLVRHLSNSSNCQVPDRKMQLLSFVKSRAHAKTRAEGEILDRAQWIRRCRKCKSCRQLTASLRTNGQGYPDFLYDAAQ